MRRLAALTGLAFFGLASSSSLVAQSGPPPLTPFRGLFDLASQNVSGSASGSSEGSPHSISGDGRYVVFASSAPDLVPNDVNYASDVFLRDRTAGTTARMSVAAGGGDPDGMSQMAAISTNGRHVAFASGASNLVAGDANGHWDVFVRDLDANRTVLVSVATGGAQTDADSGFPAISADGRYVAFGSTASTLVPGIAPYGPMEIYLHDRDSDGDGIFDEPDGTTTSLVSVGLDGAPADAWARRPRVSADGRYVMFESSAANLDEAGNPNNLLHLYVRDRVSAQTALIDRAVTGGPSAWGVNYDGSDMSDDGRFITYASLSPDIVPFEINGQAQVFRYDASAEPASQTTLITRPALGPIGDGWSASTSVSGDGRYVAFTTTSANLALPAPSAGTAALLVYDGVDGSLTRVDAFDNGLGFDGQLMNTSLSADGTAIAFESSANVFPGSGFGSHTIAVATALSVSAPVPAPQAGGAGSIEVNTTDVSGWNAMSFVDWIVLTGGETYAAGPRVLHYTVSPNTTFAVRNGQVRVGSRLVTIHQDGDGGDTTPPQIQAVVTGTQGTEGWYTSNVDVSWTVVDPESQILGQGVNCTTTTTIAIDALYAPITCEATSHGGTNSQTVIVRRDATAPTIAIAMPVQTMYWFTNGLAPEFSCNDAGPSGLATCAISQGSDPLDMTPGRHVFAVTATDHAGNTTTRSVDYFVESRVCVSPPAASAHLQGWWKFDGNLRDSVTGRDASWALGAGTFQSAIVQLGWDDMYSDNYLWAGDAGATLAGEGLTVAAWVMPRAHSGSSGTIVSNPLQYRIDRDADGTLRWAFNTTAGFDWVDTGVLLPAWVWSHVAVTYEGGVVRSYVNGRLVHSAPLAGDLITGAPFEVLTIGGRYDTVATLNGRLDEVMIFDAALPADDIDALALAGGGGLCTPVTTSTLTVTAPPTIGYGSTFQVSAQLMPRERPVANRAVTFTSATTPGIVANGTTDANGAVTATFQVDPSVAITDFPDGIVASFAGDDVFGATEARAGTTVVPGTPPLELASHLFITYGRPVDDLFVAFSTVPGTFVFSPAAGTMLDAGTYPLSVTLTPDDLTHWAPRTLTRPMVVRKAWPTIDLPAAPLVYNGQPRQANVTVRGVGGVDLSPFTVLYNGGTTLPVNAGAYTIEARYDGSANYNADSRTGTLTILKVGPSLTWSVPTNIAYGTPLGPGQLNATANVAGTFTYSPAAGTVLNAGVRTLSVTFTPADAVNYASATTSVTLNVTKATPTITWANPADIVYGTALGAAQLNATASVPGSFRYFPSTGAVFNAGPHTLLVTFTPADTANYNTATATVPLNVTKAAPAISWATPAGIVYGTALGAAQLNATASVGGTFAYSPAAGTMLGAGSRLLSVTFTPSDIVNYSVALEARVLNVSPAPLVIRANDVSKPFGAPVPPLSATATGFVNGESMASLSGALMISTPATAASPVGTYAIAAGGVSSPNYAIALTAGTLTVAPASTVTSVVASPNPGGLNQPVTLTATVAVVAPGAGAPAGTVTFFDGSTTLGVAMLAGGTASLTTNGFAAGSHTINATYGGETSFAASAGNTTLTVKTSTASSTTDVTSSANPSAVGQTITLTATVSAPSGLSGSVQFYDAGTLLGTATLSGTTARLFNVSLEAGGHAITARYLGNATIPPSVSPTLAQYVRTSSSTRTSTVALAASPSPATMGSAVLLTATVTGSQNRAPGGVVLFMINGVVLGQGTVSQTGTVTAAVSLPATLPHGVQRVEAVYLGDTTYRASRAQISLVVN